MNVRDSDNRLTRSSAVQLVQDEEIVPILAAASLLNTIDKSIDRTGPGSARITFEVTARDMPGDIFRRENMFYSPENVSEAAIGEFYEFIAFLAGNQFNAVTIMDVQVDISVSQERRTARILSARPAKPTARPGDTVDIDVKLKPYRGEPITRTVAYTVPRDQAAGTLSLTVRGGGMFPLAQLLLKKLAADIEAPKNSRKKQKTFEELIKEFDSRDRNNDIVVEPTDAAATPDIGGEEEFDKKPKTTLGEKSARDSAMPPKPGKPEKPPLKTPVSGGAASLLAPKKSDKNKGVLTTDYIVDADTQVSLEIVSK